MLYHIDTDLGVDDALAIVVAHRLMGDSLFALSTTSGNVRLEIATRNALLVRALLGLGDKLPIYCGAPNDGKMPDARDFHGVDGLGGATLAFANVMASGLGDARRIDALQGPGGGDQIALIGLGPATNLPCLVSLYGKARVARIVLMSGAFFDRGNVTPHAEFNAYCDTGALQETLRLGVRVTFVPLDVCRKVQLARATTAQWGAQKPTPLAKLLTAAHVAYMDAYRAFEGIDGCFPHDTIAVLAALHPERLFRVSGRVTVERSGELRGRTRIDPERDGAIDVVTGGELRWMRETLRQLQL